MEHDVAAELRPAWPLQGGPIRPIRLLRRTRKTKIIRLGRSTRWCRKQHTFPASTYLSLCCGEIEGEQIVGCFFFILFFRLYLNAAAAPNSLVEHTVYIFILVREARRSVKFVCCLSIEKAWRAPLPDGGSTCRCLLCTCVLWKEAVTNDFIIYRRESLWIVRWVNVDGVVLFEKGA